MRPATTPEKRPPGILLIYRDVLKPGSDAAFKAVEEDAARVCAELNCPNAHLAMESLNGPKEVWWLTPFATESEKQRIVDGYANNLALVAALKKISKRRENLVEPGADLFTNYRPDLSQDDSWKIAGARFSVVTVTKGDSLPPGSVFEAPDGTRFVICLVQSLEEAEALREAAGLQTMTFAVRPYWGMPAKEWISADPEFWRINPAFGGGSP